MKVFFSCKRCLSVVGAKHEIEALRDALDEMLEDENESTEIQFHGGKQTRFPLVVTVFEDRFSGERPSKMMIVP